MNDDSATSIADALKTGTGLGVKIGILDTGISDLPELTDAIEKHFRIVDENNKIDVIELPRGEDKLSHGTACASIIRRHAPDAKIHDLQVMDFKAQNSRHKLAAGIKFATSQGLDILNICVGSQTDFSRLREII